jgi:hypothetical protein
MGPGLLCTILSLLPRLLTLETKGLGFTVGHPLQLFPLSRHRIAS